MPGVADHHQQIVLGENFRLIVLESGSMVACLLDILIQPETMGVAASPACHCNILFNELVHRLLAHLAVLKDSGMLVSQSEMSFDVCQLLIGWDSIQIVHNLVGDLLEPLKQSISAGIGPDKRDAAVGISVLEDHDLARVGGVRTGWCGVWGGGGGGGELWGAVAEWLCGVRVGGRGWSGWAGWVGWWGGTGEVGPWAQEQGLHG